MNTYLEQLETAVKNKLKAKGISAFSYDVKALIEVLAEELYKLKNLQPNKNSISKP